MQYVLYYRSFGYYKIGACQSTILYKIYNNASEWAGSLRFFRSVMNFFAHHHVNTHWSNRWDINSKKLSLKSTCFERIKEINFWLFMILSAYQKGRYLLISIIRLTLQFLLANQKIITFPFFAKKCTFNLQLKCVRTTSRLCPINEHVH